MAYGIAVADATTSRQVGLNSGSFAGAIAGAITLRREGALRASVAGAVADAITAHHQTLSYVRGTTYNNGRIMPI